MKTFLFLFTLTCLGNPYPDPDKVWQGPFLDENAGFAGKLSEEEVPPHTNEAFQGLPVVRVQIDWDEVSDSFKFEGSYLESSGTKALYDRATQRDSLGSYIGILKDRSTGNPIYFDSIGTGSHYRKLSRALSFRFPKFDSEMDFELIAENPATGKMESVLNVPLVKEDIKPIAVQSVSTKILKQSKEPTSILITIYSEGYTKGGEKNFFKEAEKVIKVLESQPFPGFEYFSFQAVFAPSNEIVGPARSLGLPVPERDSFLGLYYPYWGFDGRWFHVLYPTREKRYRDGIGQVAYDYPVILLDSSLYFGVGNYMELTAIPSRSMQFGYLLLHEFGHFLGLNEEYEGGGMTELEFSKNIEEPWSQNITFQTERENVKWAFLIEPTTPVPTPASEWKTNPSKYGVYKGGYADSNTSKSHKPGFNCVMEAGKEFCMVCKDALLKRIKFHMGL